MAERQAEAEKRRRRIAARDRLIARLRHGAAWLRETYDVLPPGPARECPAEWDRWCHAFKGWYDMQAMVRELFGWQGCVCEGDTETAIAVCDACIAASEAGKAAA